MERFILFGTYCENAIDKREPFRNKHLKHLSELKEQGLLITLGPTKCNKYVFGIFEASSLKEVEDALKDDVYFSHGIWTSVEVYPWTQAF